MSDVVILVDGLGKKYRLGVQRQPYYSLRDSLAKCASAPLRLLRPAAHSSSDSAARARLRDFWAVKDVDFDIKYGEVLGIIGRNGAGKSTLLKLISEITEPTAGRIMVRGRVASLLEVGTGFHPELTGRENVYLNGAILGMHKAEILRKFDEIVTFAEVEQFLDTQVKFFSSGMYLRLAFAVAAHLEPEILIVDEVLAVGDAGFQKKCLGKMSQISRTGRTVLFVSHSMSAIRDLCTRCLLLGTGRLVMDGEPAAVIDQYISSIEVGNYAQQLSRSGHSGTGMVRFVDFSLLDVRGCGVQQVTSGETCSLNLTYASSLAGDLRNCRVSIAVNDALGHMLFLCSTETTVSGELSLPPSGTVSCCIPRLPLSAGRYYVTLFFERGPDVEDLVESAVAFDVVDGSFFPCAKQYPDGFAGRGVLVDHDWKVV